MFSYGPSVHFHTFMLCFCLLKSTLCVIFMFSRGRGHVIVLSCYHVIMLSCYHVIMLSCYCFINLSCYYVINYHIGKFSCFYAFTHYFYIFYFLVIMFSYCCYHTGIFACYHVIRISFYYVIVLSI